jgi:hypothetical protein
MDAIAAAVPARARVLVLADWRADPRAVVAACRFRASQGDAAFALVVPAWLHGLDWAGDPHASRPCAARQLETLLRLAGAAGLDVELAAMGDPDPTSAVDDALHEFPAGEILVCRDRPARAHPLDLPHRLRRMTGLPVDTPALRARSGSRARRRWGILLGGGHCVAEAR